MSQNDKLKLSILVNGQEMYFNAPIFTEVKIRDGEENLILRTQIGQPTPQNIEIVIKKPTYIESIIIKNESISDATGPDTGELAADTTK